MDSTFFTGDELTCPNCDGNTLRQIAGAEHANPVSRTQLWECTNCEYREER